MNNLSLEEEQASIQQDIIKLQLHSVPFNLNFDEVVEEEEEEEDDEEEDFLLSVLDDTDIPSTSGLNKHTDLQIIQHLEIVETADDNEEEVIDLSSDLRAIPENLLKLNLAYQNSIEQQLRVTEEALQKNKFAQEEIEIMIKKKKEESKLGSGQPRANLGLCIAPYFNAWGKFGPTPNKDVVRRKAELGDYFIVDTLPPRQWKKCSEEALMKGVEYDSIRTKTKPLLVKLDHLREKLKKAKNADEILRKIAVVEKQVSDIQELKLSVKLGERGTEHDWDTISNVDLDEIHSPIECELWWKNHLHPNINIGPWTAQEEKKLKELVKSNKERDWPTIAKELGTNRTAMQCIQFYQQKINVNFKKEPWTPEEDERLKNLVERFNVGDEIPYSSIACRLKNRTSIQCIHRWTKSIDPKYKKTRWTPEEDIQLLRSIARYGLKWSLMRDLNCVPGRNDAQMRERYANVLVGTKKGRWTQEEDELLLQQCKKHGEKWAVIARGLGGRTDGQCLKRIQILRNAQAQGKSISYHGFTAGMAYDNEMQKLRHRLMRQIAEDMKHKENRDPVQSTGQPSEEISEAVESKKLMEKFNQEMSSKEMIDFYHQASTHKPKILFYEKTTRKSKTCQRNAKLLSAVSRHYRPYKIVARKNGTNLNFIRRKVLHSAATIPQKIIFIHYVKAMNINAASTLESIREKNKMLLNNKKKNSVADAENQNPEIEKDADVHIEKVKNKAKELDTKDNNQKENESTEPSSKKPQFKRNLCLPLCAPNRATLQAYKTFMEDRDTRVKKAKTILKFENHTKPDQETPDPASEEGDGEDEAPCTSQQTTTSNVETESGDNTEKFRPEDLVKHFQASKLHKIFRSRFVSLFAWPTILASLVPYNRTGIDGTMKPVVRMRKFKDERRRSIENEIPMKRRKINQNNDTTFDEAEDVANFEELK